MDSAVGMKKKRLAAMQAKKKQEAEQKKVAGLFSVAEADFGASPQMSKGSIYSKK